MKTFRTITVFSDGSFYFSSELETGLTNKLVVFQRHDDKNFILNQRKDKKNVESKYSSFYKKKYLK
jgi:hypothetical protein